MKKRIVGPTGLAVAVVLFGLPGCNRSGGGGGGPAGEVNDGVLSSSDTYDLRSLEATGGTHAAIAGPYAVTGALTLSPTGETSGFLGGVSAGPIAAQQ